MERAKFPEEVGVSSKGLYDLLMKLKASDNEHHSMVVLSHGKIAYENYVYPYSADINNQLFSCTKSLVATAVGFAISEGLVKLSDKIVDFFPEYEYSAGTEKLTLENVMTMNSGKKFSFMQDMTADYVEIFLKAGFRKEAGFRYSNNDAHMAGAVIQKVTGQTLVDYLTPRFFEPLGIEKPFWETDCKGLCVGGTGLYLKTMDIAKICQTYLDDGKFEGKQILPAEWCKQVAVERIRTSAAKGNRRYGYLFWLADSSVRMDGMFGQFGFYFTKKNGVIAITNCKVAEKVIYKAILEAENSIFVENAKPDEKSLKLLDDFYKKESYKVKTSPNTASLVEGMKGKVYHSCGFGKLVTNLTKIPSSVIPMALYKSQAKYGRTGINEISLSANADGNIVLTWKEEGEVVNFVAGTNGKPIVTEIVKKGYPYKIWAFAYEKDGALHVEYKPLNTVGTQHMVFKFSQNKFKLNITAVPDMGEFCTINGIEGGVLPTAPILKPIVCKAVDLAFALCFGKLKFKS